MTDKEILNFLTKDLGFSSDEAATLLISINHMAERITDQEITDHWSARKVG